ncbi:MAG TPA: 2-oxo acid dehydrogenase subunit E2 [Streptosporangiaceae bacterium]|jgi:pyruvate dehydrogenase E2 component (dihydrolipoamide acetyltransferase)|nr:2-oxo acid dehydrogenase subunit E2 [Streptosporangiaceae bacterium]
MSVSVSMPQLGESVTEGTVTRWLKREGEHVEADEPLLEVSTDKVDTEIPSPVSGVLRGITVAEDETVAVGAELAVIDEDGAAAAAQPAAAPAEAPAAEAPEASAPPPPPAPAPEPEPVAEAPAPYEAPAPPPQAPVYEAPAAPAYEPAATPAYEPAAAPAYAPPPAAAYAPPAPPPAVAYEPPAPTAPEAGNGVAESAVVQPDAADGPYVTPLVRKLAAEHGIDLATVSGTGVGGRIRKQDILDAARVARGPEVQPAAAAPAPPAAPALAAQTIAPPPPAAPAPAPAPAPAAAPAFRPEPAAPQRSAIVPSSLRGTTERMSRARQVIAQRMVESLQVSAQLTTVVEADVTAIARLRDRAKAAFEAREGVKLSFLPFFALATVESLKVHPKLNAVIDTASGQVTYHDAEHLGIAVDTERGLMVPVIRNAGDLNIGGLARKIADLAERTRAGQVSPDDLAGGTFTLTNTGSRGALFDTPIINQPQVGILGTGTVVKRAVVVEDPTLGEVITVRSMVYLALTYDHRLVDGADAARFLVTMKARLEEGAFETELGL